MGANCSVISQCCTVDKEKTDPAELNLLDPDPNDEDRQAQHQYVTSSNLNQYEDTGKVSKKDGTGGTQIRVNTPTNELAKDEYDRQRPSDTG